jgi:hypothetical protein
MAEEEEEETKCFCCNNYCSLECSRCNAVFFCSRDCQKKCWNDTAHKPFCLSVSSPSISETASETSKTCLIVEGLGPRGAMSDAAEITKSTLLNAGLNVIVVNASKGSNLPEQIAALLEHTDRVQVTIMLGWGSEDMRIGIRLGASLPFRTAVTEWVDRGGQFFVHGERMTIFGDWPKWFDKGWTQGGCYKANHTCFPRMLANHPTSWYCEKPGAITENYDVKAVMLKNVDYNDVIFGSAESSVSYNLIPGFGQHQNRAASTAIALSKYGDGELGFFGDISLERPTLKIMATLAQGKDK